MLGKRVVGMCSFGRCTSRSVQKAQNYFDFEDWKQCLRVVKQFYQNHTKFSEEICPTFVPVKNDNRPYVKISIYDKKLVALLDSGANSSIIGTAGLKIISLFELKVHNAESRYVSTADGKRHPIKGVVLLSICVGSTCRIIKAFVVPNLKHSIILGSDFCNKFKVSLDFHNCTWDVKSCEGRELCSLESCEIDICAETSEEAASKPTGEQLAKITEVKRTFEELCKDGKLGRTNRYRGR